MLINVIEEGNFVVSSLNDAQVEKVLEIFERYGFETEYDETWCEIFISQQRISTVEELNQDYNILMDKVVTNDPTHLLTLTSAKLERENREFEGERADCLCLYSEGEFNAPEGVEQYKDNEPSDIESLDELGFDEEQEDSDLWNIDYTDDDLVEEEPTLSFEDLFGFFDLSEEEVVDEPTEEVELDFGRVISDAIENLVPGATVTVIGFDSDEELQAALDELTNSL